MFRSPDAKHFEGFPVRPFVIAEAGVNHEGDLNIAKRLIAEAKDGGADAIKFQTYRAKTLASRHSPAYWDVAKEPTKSQFELFSKYDSFGFHEYEILKAECDRLDIEFLSTPFDLESAKFLNDLVDVFKIASADLTNRPFIEYICAFRKPILLSTGGSDLSEIREAVGWTDAHSSKVALLHCVLSYPVEDRDANLGMIAGLRRAFPDRIIGYSDHTLPKDLTVLELAVAFGAAVVEKHFTHDKTLPGNDHYHAMDKEDLRAFRRKVDRVLTLFGRSERSVLDSEAPARTYARRSLVASRRIEAGSVIDADDLTWKRPGTGISPKDVANVIGQVAARTIEEDEILQWADLRS